MPELTKKHHIELTFKGPLINKEKAITTLKDLGYVECSDSVSWQTVFPVSFFENHSGTILRGMRHRDGLTQKELAGKIGIKQNHISEIENGKRQIGKELAKKLGEFFNVSALVFLSPH